MSKARERVPVGLSEPEGRYNEDENDEEDDRSRDANHPVTRTEPKASYCPTQAWERQWGEVFRWEADQTQKASVRAKEFARKNRRAIYALEVTDGARTMNYVVGSWETAVDMVVLGQLRGPGGRLTPMMMRNPRALSAVYECVFDDQRVLPYFDLEFYSDAARGNAHRNSPRLMDRMTRSVAYLASQLMAELFADQVCLEGICGSASHDMLQAAVHGDPDRSAKDSTVQNLIEKHYRAPQGLAVEPAPLDPERHWHVLDASRDAKRSHHLILDAGSGMCWDTQIDQSIFVGLLYRRIYRLAFSNNVDGDDEKTTRARLLQSMARSLFIQEETSVTNEKRGLTNVPAHNWTLVIDPVVYKRFQLIRTAFSSKRTQNRPFCFRNDVFDDSCLTGGEVPPTPEQILRATLVGRVGQSHGQVHRLSFARCYPAMFGLNPANTGPIPPSSALSLVQWKWVPNYFGRGPNAPPRLIHKQGEPHARGAWRFENHVKAVHAWQKRIDPCSTDPIESSLSGSGKRRHHHQWERATTQPNAGPPPDFLLTSVPTTAKECVAHFIAQSSLLSPWVAEAKGLPQLAQLLKIEVSECRDPKTGRLLLSALASPNLHYCPVFGRNHSGNGAFITINGRYGYVTVSCRSSHCEGRKVRPYIAMLPEYLDIVFPQRSRARRLPSLPPLKKKQKTGM